MTQQCGLESISLSISNPAICSLTGWAVTPAPAESVGESAHLTGRGCFVFLGTLADYLPDRRIFAQLLGIIRVIIARQATVDRLPELTVQGVLCVQTAARGHKKFGHPVGQTQRLIQLPKGSNPASDVTLAPWNSTFAERSKSTRNASLRPSPIGYFDQPYVSSL